MPGQLGKALFAELTSSTWDQPKHSQAETLGVAFASHLGLVRSRNEDRLALATISSANSPSYIMAIVCDGVGGSLKGDTAATIAITTLISELAYSNARLPIPELLRHVIRTTDDKVRECLKGQGTTTASIVLISSDGELLGINIGDSRIFSGSPAKPKELNQVSTDDTIENELKILNIKDHSILYENGLMGSLSQAIGELGRDAKSLSIKPIYRDRFFGRVILASDGLWKRTQGTFALVIENSKSSLEAVKRAITLANWTGGVDNSSIIVIDDIDNLREQCAKLKCKSDSGLHVSVWFSDQKFVFYQAPQKTAHEPTDGNKPFAKRVKRTRPSKDRRTENAPAEQLDLSVDTAPTKSERRTSNRAKIQIEVDNSSDEDSKT